ncbi:hypothetical protein KQ304_05185 [Synechococcus sp. CS-1329]|uniref:hypothetical protein n=1 Tax=Synechococcus sp. CS-1329 TaxID=2847975 RepID=UPI00223B51FF|nr:hypothetical protein [Synechococcus sp. CS-1329]MCT0218400.1 hypothetical protein [Synechococcus sp. CS-1329]
MKPQTLDPRSLQRRRLLFRYLHHVERTGRGLHPALVAHLNPPKPEPKPIAKAEAPATVEIPPAPQPQAPVVMINNVVSSPAPLAASAPQSETAPIQTVDISATSSTDLAVDQAFTDLLQDAGSGMARLTAATEAVETSDDDGTAAAAAGADPARQLMLRAIQEIRRSGRCDHPGLEASLEALREAPAIERHNPAAALQLSLSSITTQLQGLRSQLLAIGDLQQPHAGLTAIVVKLRSCRRRLWAVQASYASSLHESSLAIMRRQLRQARRLDWRLRWGLHRRSHDGLLTALALAMAEILQAVSALWPQPAQS